MKLLMKGKTKKSTATKLIYRLLPDCLNITISPQTSPILNIQKRSSVFLYVYNKVNLLRMNLNTEYCVAYLDT